MNGFSLLLALASLNVVYSYRTGIDKQQEFLLQVEPEVIPALAAGEKIKADLNPEAGQFQRLCIVILPKDGTPGRHTLAGEDQFRKLLLYNGRTASADRSLLTTDVPPTILWSGRPGSNPEPTTGISTGWEPDAAGSQQFIVQVDPALLSSLSVGDELYVPIDPAAGRIALLVVKTGKENLVRTTLPSSQFNAGANDPAVDPRNPAYPYSSSPATQTTRGGYQNPQSGYGYQDASRSGSTQFNSNADAFRSTGQYGTAGTRQGTSYLDPTRDNGYPAGYGQTAANQTPQFNSPQYPSPPYNPTQFNGPQYNSPQRQYTSYPDTQSTRQPPLTTTPTAAVNQGGVAMPGVAVPGVSVPLGSTIQTTQDKPWGPLLFVTFALFFSIGGNLYLAYTALEFHSRYRNAIERLRSAARSA